MSVHKLKDGRWIVKYKRDGKWKREYFGRGLEAQQRAWARNAELAPRAWVRRTPGEESPVFADLVDAYLVGRRAHLADSTMDRLLIKLRAVILPELGGLRASGINHHRMDLYVNKRLKTGVKRTTVYREVSDIQAVLNFAVRRSFLHDNPLAGYDKPKRDDAEIRPVTLSEVRAILARAAPHIKRALILSFYTGLRPGLAELLRITWDSVDWDRETVTIHSARKGGVPSRTVPAHPQLMECLYCWFEADLDVDIDLIVHYKGRAVNAIKKGFAAAKHRAGIKRKLPMYAFRHAFVTTLLGEGADLKSTSELAGHTRTDTTTRVYQHTGTALHRAAIDKLPDLVTP